MTPGVKFSGTAWGSTRKRYGQCQIVGFTRQAGRSRLKASSRSAETCVAPRKRLVREFSDCKVSIPGIGNLCSLQVQPFTRNVADFPPPEATLETPHK